MAPKTIPDVPRVSEGDIQFLDDREVDVLIARTIAHCEHAGIAPPSPERAREMIAEFDAFLAGAIDARGRPH